MQFKDVKYERPDAEAVKKEYAKLSEQFKNAKSFEEADRAFCSAEELSAHFSSMYCISYIRHSIDTRDKFYEDEQNYFNTVMPEVEEFAQDFKLALLDSPFRADFEKKYPGPMFINLEYQVKSFSPEIIGEMQQENDLAQKYEKLLASALIPFRGGVYTLPQLSPFETDLDDETRLEAWKAEGKWFKENQKEMDEIYDKLVHLRDAMGKKLGYDNYLPLGYYRMARTSYGKKEVENFRKGVVDYVVPLVTKICKARADRLGFAFPMSYAENALIFRDGNPRPKGSPEDIVAAGKKFYEELSPETAAFFNEMLEKGMMDLLSKEGKASGGYCEDVQDLHMPFIFANFNGTQDDIEVITHEAGHAFAGWISRDKFPREYQCPGMESCEVHSMSMEFFAENWSEDFLGKDAEKYNYSHLSGTLEFLPYGTMVDHFQHIMYEQPDLTPRQRHDVWKELLGIYMPWLRLDGEIPFYADGEGWQMKHHIYSLPLYYIDYCLAGTVALEFWAMIQDDPKAAWEKYMAYTVQGGTATFTELLANAGLDSPFDPSTLKTVCEKAGERLLRNL